MTSKYGFCLPLFANPGAAYFRTPALQRLDPVAVADAAVEAERLGYDSIWVADHLMHGHDGAIMEGWTTLSFVAGRTQRVELGTIHLAQPFRHPAILAKMAATLDALSNGRLILFYDAGWGEAEVQAYGLDWPEAAERVARMDEGMDLIKALWAAQNQESPLSFSGTYFHTKDAVCLPAPVARAGRPRPPLWLGETWDERWLDVVARQADGWNSAPASLDRMKERLERVRAACERAGRDPQTLEVSLEIQILIAPTEREAQETARQIAALPPSRRGRVREDIVRSLEGSDGRPLSELAPDWLVGSPEAVAEQISAYEALGVSHFILWFLDYPSMDGMRLFAERVLRR